MFPKTLQPKSSTRPCKPLSVSVSLTIVLYYSRYIHSLVLSDAPDSQHGDLNFAKSAATHAYGAGAVAVDGAMKAPKPTVTVGNVNVSFAVSVY